MAFLGILFPLIGVGAIFAAWLYIKNDEQGSTTQQKSKKRKNKNTTLNENDEDKDKDSKSSSKSEIKDLIGIKDIKNKIIYLKDGGMRMILSISSPDFELLTDEEQTIFEDGLRQFALILTSPVLFFTTPTRIETKEPLEAVTRLIDENDENIPEKLKIYASQFYNQLKELENTKGIYVRKSFCVVGVNSSNNEKKALNELRARVELVAGGLSQSRMKVNFLDSEQVAQLLADVLNKGNNILISQLMKDGILELYVEGSGKIIYEEKQEI